LDPKLNNQKIFIVNSVLESSLGAGVEDYVAACRRLLWANLRGWRKHADRNDWKLVFNAYADMRADHVG
jgi:hypothetical protein